jgi:hypothetical protein
MTKIMKTFFILRIVVLVLFLPGCATSLNRFKPFSGYVGQEVALKRSCVLEEYIANNSGTLYAFWENDQPTDLVYDDRMWAKPAKTVVNDYRQEQELYPASDYNKRIYCLRESELWTGVNRRNYGGPYRVHQVPAGTKIFIENVINFNGIDSISKSAKGHMAIPGTSTEVNFTYDFSDGASAHGTMSDYIARAPWEDESAPEEVFVGWTGAENNSKSK